MDPNTVRIQQQSSHSSATTSYLFDQTNCVGPEAYRQHRYDRASSPEVETMLDRFMSTCNDGDDSETPPAKRQEVEASESLVRSKMSLGIGSDLVRQTSSPAGFFADFSADNNGFATTRVDRRPDIVGFNFYTPRIGEAGSGNVEVSGSGYFDGSENGAKIVSTSTASKARTVEFGNWNGGLTHHSSLPKDYFSMAGRERVLDFQGSIPPCNVRAKRGFATHPRSIAERNRRTRINERMKKVQDLFPNLDKQANTSDKLELVVEYIKDLQKQIKILTDTKAKCLCSSKKRHYPTNPSS